MTALPHVALADTGLEVSALGLGTVELGMPYGIGAPPPPADAECVALLHRAVDLGIDYVDTAAGYGRSEELIGMAFGENAGTHRPVIATKVALADPDGREWTASQMAAGVRQSVERSLRRLRRDALDLLQVHNFSLDLGHAPERVEALLLALQREVAAGRVRHWGASTYGDEAPLAALATEPAPAVLQVAYSVLDRGLEEQVFPTCRQRGTALILRSVFLKGVLTERRQGLHPDLVDLRRAADQVAAVAEGLGVPLPQVALRFALYESGAAVTLVGTAETAELAANVAAARAGALPADAVAALRAIRVQDPRLLNPGNWPDA